VKHENGDPTAYVKLYFSAAGVMPFGKVGFGKFLTSIDTANEGSYGQMKCKYRCSQLLYPYL